MVIGKNKKDILNLLIYKWKMLAKYVAIEKARKKQVELAKRIGMQLPPQHTFLNVGVSEQMSLVRQKISEILPEAEFVNMEYEAPAELQPDDFIELFINHQDICIQRIREIISKKYRNGV
jgi:hypothetical protein